jgi:RNA polymerase-interacting CarD/CdnL/TRCF family regulator
MEPAHQYSVEDWLVHSAFGIGQIIGVEEKSISGAKVQYFKIKTADSTYWMPVDRMDSEDLRPVSGTADIEGVIAILLGPPEAMAQKHLVRKNDIQRLTLLNTPADTARLIRDLRAHQRARGTLNLEELYAFRALKQRLVEEWVVVTGEQAEQVDARIDDLLNGDHPSAEDD